MTDRKSSIHIEISNILEECGKGDYIFRGEEKDFGEVSSNLYRSYGQSHSFSALHLEKDTVENAKRHFRPSTSNIEILTELQHHGGKTALIDFTRNIYIALFFACDEELDMESSDGRIICLDLKNMKRRGEIDYGKKEDYKEDAWIVPAGKDPRVVFQSSVFVHAPKGYISSKYKTIVIKQELKSKFLDYLDRYFNITRESIYNDIHGFIKHYRPPAYEYGSAEQMQLDPD